MEPRRSVIWDFISLVNTKKSSDKGAFKLTEGPFTQIVIVNAPVMVSLENGVATHFGAIPFISVKSITIVTASLTLHWCKRTPTETEAATKNFHAAPRPKSTYWVAILSASVLDSVSVNSS